MESEYEREPESKQPTDVRGTDAVTDDPNSKGIETIGFMVDENPCVFIVEREANSRFLRGLDADHWEYQALVHGEQLGSDDPKIRQHAAVGLRLAYAQGLETLFALIGALVQVPTFPLAWVMSYRVSNLRSVVRKLHEGSAFPTLLTGRPSWEAVSAAVHQFLNEDVRKRTVQPFAQLWGRFADEFLEESFSAEYNSLKHGMRVIVGGSSLAVGIERGPGEQPEPGGMRVVAACDYGSTFEMRPRRVDGTRHTFELPANISSAWVPEHFAAALPLISMSISNVVSRARIAAGEQPGKVEFRWPQDPANFDRPWRQPRPTMKQLRFGRTVHLQGYSEMSVESIREAYENRSGGMTR
jgi:hypothetical protein